MRKHSARRRSAASATTAAPMAAFQSGSGMKCAETGAWESRPDGDKVVRDADVICAALLHRRGRGPRRGASRGRRTGRCPGRAGRAVRRPRGRAGGVCHQPPHEPGRDRHDQYREHVAASLETSPWARVIKASDFTDNGVGLIHTTGPRADRLADKYAPLVPVLADLIARPDAPLSDGAKERILGQLDRARQRFSAIKPTADPAAAAGMDSVRGAVCAARLARDRSLAKPAEATSGPEPCGHSAMPSS
jgi:hypothetical protein